MVGCGVFGEPPVADDVVADLLREHWGLDVTVAYAPVGFGSYHWWATAKDSKLFVTLDDFGGMTDPVERDRRIDSALRRYRCAFKLAQSGRRFARGPIPTPAGGVVVMEGVRLFSLWPHVDGRSSDDGPYHDDDDRRAVLSVLAELHATDPAGLDLDLDGFHPEQRDFLEHILESPGDDWDRGPYGPRARALLDQNACGISRLLSHYDELVAKAPPRRDWVVTHGEPHMANVVFGVDGPVLIDWDTVAIAPHERDLWMVVTADESVGGAYADSTGHRPDSEMLKLYRAQWDLSEMGIYFNHFHKPHANGPDDIESWNDLSQYLPVEPRWPDLL